MCQSYREPLTTDQKVGGSSPSGRAADRSGGFPEIPPLLPFPAWRTEPAPTQDGAHTSAHIYDSRGLSAAEQHWADHPEERECRSPRMLGRCLLLFALAVAGVALAAAILR